MKLLVSLALAALLFSPMAIARPKQPGHRQTSGNSVKSCEGKKGKALKACLKSAKIHKKKKKSRY